MKLFHLDVETTGTDPQIHAMVQLSGFIEIDGQVAEEVNLDIRPFKGDMMSKEALEVTGKTVEELRGYPSPKSVYSALIMTMEKYVDRYDRTDKFYLVGYNSDFDSDFVRRFFEKNEDEYYGSWFHWPAICVAKMAAIHFMTNGGRPPSFKLMAVAEALDIQVDESHAHDALYDIIITKQIFELLTQSKNEVK